MNSTILLEKLIEIERSIGTETESTLRRKVLDAEECLLRMHRELVDRLRVRGGLTDTQRLAAMSGLSVHRKPEEGL